MTAIQVTSTKWCIKCVSLRPVEDFGPNRVRPDGLSVYCRPCMRPIERRTALKRRYGLTPEQLKVMWSRQNGSCAICITPFERKPKSFHVDHCHRTGRVRALLCQGCNYGLGAFKERKHALSNAVAYLAHFEM